MQPPEYKIVYSLTQAFQTLFNPPLLQQNSSLALANMLFPFSKSLFVLATSVFPRATRGCLESLIRLDESSL